MVHDYLFALDVVVDVFRGLLFHLGVLIFFFCYLLRGFVFFSLGDPHLPPTHLAMFLH